MEQWNVVWRSWNAEVVQAMWGTLLWLPGVSLNNWAKKLALLRFSWQMLFVEINLTAKRSQEMKLWKVAFTGSWQRIHQQKTLWRWPCTGVSWKCTNGIAASRNWDSLHASPASSGPSSQKSGGSSRYRHSPKEEKLQEGPSSQKVRSILRANAPRRAEFPEVRSILRAAVKRNGWQLVLAVPWVTRCEPRSFLRFIFAEKGFFFQIVQRS